MFYVLFELDKDLSFKDVVIPLPGGNVSIPSLYDPIYDVYKYIFSLII